jgi:hypothetical protein
VTRPARRPRRLPAGQRRAGLPGGDRPPQSELYRHAAAFAIGAVVAVAAAVVLRRAREGVHPAYVVCLVLVAVAVSRLVVAVRSVEEPDREVAVEDVPEPAPYRDLVFLEERLSWGSVDRQRFDDRVRPQLVRLTAERVRQRYGVDLLDDPDRGRPIVGEELWTFLTAPADPGGRPIGHREIERLISRIEAL